MTSINRASGVTHHTALPQSKPPGDAPIGSCYDLYAHRFKEISVKNRGPRIIRIMRSVIAFFKDSIKSKQRFAVHVSLEYMSNGPYAGDRISRALLETRKILIQMGTDHALKMEKIFRTNNNLPSKVKKNIRNLQVGESALVPFGSKGHQMTLFITCSGECEEKKTYRMEVHNTGDGIEDYHYRKVDDNGKQLYQTPLVITSIPGENLYGEKSVFFKNILHVSVPFFLWPSVTTCYEKIISLVGGKIEGPSSNPAYWDPAQLGGSCTASCLRSVLKCHLPPEDYDRFKEIASYEMLLRTYKHILSGKGSSTDQKIVALEMVQKIQDFLAEKGVQKLPAELERMRNQLQEMIPKKKRASKFLGIVQSHFTKDVLLTKKGFIDRLRLNRVLIDKQFKIDANGYFATEDIIDNLNFAFTILKAHTLSPDNLKEMEAYIAKCNALIQNVIDTKQEISRDTLKRFIQVSQHIVNYEKKQPLTKQKIYYMTLISTSILESLSDYIKELDKIKKSEKSNQFLIKSERLLLKKNQHFFENQNLCARMHRAFNALGLKNKETTLKEIASHARLYQRVLFEPSDPSTPDGMKAMQEAMTKHRNRVIQQPESTHQAEKEESDPTEIKSSLRCLCQDIQKRRKQVNKMVKEVKQILDDIKKVEDQGGKAKYLLIEVGALLKKYKEEVEKIENLLKQKDELEKERD